MTKFLNNNELILLVLVMLLFNFNGFCGTALNHIMYGKRTHMLIFLLSTLFLIYDMYIFHSVLNHDPVPDVEYKPKSVHHSLTSNDIIDDQIKNSKTHIEQLNKIKKSKKDINHNLIIEKIVFNFIFIVLLTLFISTMFISNKNNKNINRLSKRVVLASPVITVALIIGLYTNIYKKL